MFQRNPIRLEKPVTKKDKERFYNTKEWRTLAKEHKKSRHFECERCKSRGKLVKVDVTHHKKPIEDYPHLCLEWDNLESICYWCHEMEEHDKLGIVEKQKEREEKFPEFW